MKLHGSKSALWRVGYSYWSPARRLASSIYGQVATAPCIVELSQHAWRGTFLAIATTIVLQWRQSRAQMKVLDLLYPSATRNWCRGAIKAFHLATLLATA